jgi:hypothetical protein
LAKLQTELEDARSELARRVEVADDVATTAPATDAQSYAALQAAHERLRAEGSRLEAGLRAALEDEQNAHAETVLKLSGAARSLEAAERERARAEAEHIHTTGQLAQAAAGFEEDLLKLQADSALRERQMVAEVAGERSRRSQAEAAARQGQGGGVADNSSSSR